MRIRLLILLLFSPGIIFAQIPDIDSLIRASQSLEGKEKALIYSDISYYAGFNDTELAEEYAFKCLDEALETDDSLLIAEAYNALAIAMYMQSDYRSALEYNMKALDLRLRHGDDYSLLSSYSKIGNCLHELGRYDEAISYYLKALEISEANELNRQTGLISNNIAEIFKQQQNYGQAQEYYDISIRIATELNDTLGLSKALINQGVAYKQQEKFKKADSAYTAAYRMIRGRGYNDVEGGLLVNFGALYKEWGQPQKSIAFYQRAEKLYLESGEHHGLSIAYTNLGNSYLEIGANQKALTNYNKGLEHSKATGSITRLMNAYEGLTNYYRANGNYRLAFTYDSLTDVLQDSVFDIEKSRIIQELNTKYETEKKEKRLAEQQTRIARQEIRVQQKNIQLIAAGAGIILFMLIALFIYRSLKSRQQKLRQQVALEKAEAQNRIQNEKLRISRDLHDNIGSQLTFVVSSLDNLNYIRNEEKRKSRLQQLGDFTRDTMTQLRETIWALNAENISLKQLGSRIAEFVNHARQARPEIGFKVINNSGDKTINSQQAINVYRTVQEAINNATKHADAGKIIIELNDQEIRVSDNGKGFNRDTIADGHGLKNMESRIHESGFSIDIRSKEGHGTDINIHLRPEIRN